MHSIHFSVLIMLCFNSFILLVTACMKTIPAEAISLPAQLDNAPLRRMPIAPQDDYSSHIQQFRKAKTFPSPPSSASSDGSSASTTKEITSPSFGKTSNRESIKSSAKTFTVKTDVRTESSNREEEEVEVKDTEVSNREVNNVVRDDRDLFEALQVEKPDICGSCPPIWMTNSADMKDICSNHESVSAFFSMTLDKRDAKNVIDTSDLRECTRTITCSEPHMLVKWHESDLCDVHAPYTGSLVTDISNTFVYKCNGTQWTLHGFPLSSVVCAVSSN